ncbi:chorismate mutase [Lachnospiraceae bacterium YSD2013]|nr:chorismate mutase [Lachnospiraceae bacterium]MBR5994740.1 chorismate mutase [Lachnospiraceae bacterium]MCR4679797.1 chorismate mutase [Lachnospiraceae bacterium]SCX07137.1 chorismate mutase [Lachnospiraceae bacterium YSD2013]
MTDTDLQLQALRKDINAIDDELVKLFIQRMETAGKIGSLKKEAGLPVLNVKREDEVKERLTADVPEVYKESVKNLYDSIFSISRDYQESLKRK